MVSFALLCLLSQAGDTSNNALNLIPKPASVSLKAGSFSLRREPGETNCEFHYTEGAKAAATIVSQELDLDQMHVMFSLVPGLKHGKGDAITFILDPKLETGDEGYKLTVTPHRIDIRAKTTAGLFYGGQTLRQLPLEKSPTDEVAAMGPLVIPCCEIDDAPSYKWRGLMLDVSRHFRPKQDVERYLDLMAYHKLNVFHWHLVDDGGWRIEIKKYPELTRRGAWRTKESWREPVVFPAQHSNGEYGGFYTQADIKEIVAYAASRHITVVPEIEMPGHSLAAITSYPNVACTKPDGSGPVINSNYCPGKEQTFKFLTDVLDEVIALFPSKFIHIGGDEVDKTSWKACPNCQARIKSEGLHNEEELQSYFVKRIETYLNSKGRRLIGWDEILEGGLAPNATVMSWRGVEGGVEAAKQGKNVVMSPTSNCYFDYSYADISVEKVYSYNPIPDGISAEQANLILGGQGNLWTEWIPTRNRLDQMTWPRAAALSEVFWTPRSEQSWPDFERRLPTEYDRLSRMAVDFMPPSPVLPINAIVSDVPATVDFGAHGSANLTMHYTTDGSEPTAASKIVNGPLTISTDALVKAAYINTVGDAGETAKVAVHIGKVEAPVGELSPGLSEAYYEGDWDGMPDFGKLTPISTGTGVPFSIASHKREENYGFRFSGYIDIPIDGIYMFAVTSDDGAVLKIAGADVVDDSSPHGPRTISGKIQLLRGRYPIQLDYYQLGGAASLDVKVLGPGMAMQKIPAEWLGH